MADSEKIIAMKQSELVELVRQILAEMPTTLPANGGNADTVNNHTVDADVPENAEFTDTVYDDTNVLALIADNKSCIFYAECATERNVVDKVVNCDEFVLEQGAVIAIRFMDTGTANPTSGNITLNVNNTGAKNIVSKSSNTLLAYHNGWAFYGGQTYLFVYNGTNFVMLNQDNNTTYTPMSLGFGYGTCTTAETTSDKFVGLSSYALVKNGMVSVKFKYAVPANATLNVNGKGAKNIYYHGHKVTAGIIAAGDIATFVYDGTQYQLIAIDSRNALTINGHTVGCDVPADAVFTQPDLSGYAKLSDIPSSLPANGGNSDTVGGHTVKSDVPENAVFTDTKYDLSPYMKISTDIPQTDAASSVGVVTQNGVIVTRDYVAKPIDASTCTRYYRTFSPDASKYVDMRITTSAAGATVQFTGTLSITAFTVAGRQIAYKDEMPAGKVETGSVSGLANGTATSVTTSFTPKIVILFSTGHIVQSGFALSMKTNGFTITPANVSTMGTTAVDWVAFA